MDRFLADMGKLRKVCKGGKRFCIPNAYQPASHGGANAGDASEVPCRYAVPGHFSAEDPANLRRGAPSRDPLAVFQMLMGIKYRRGGMGRGAGQGGNNPPRRVKGSVDVNAHRNKAPGV